MSEQHRVFRFSIVIRFWEFPWSCRLEFQTICIVLFLFLNKSSNLENCCCSENWGLDNLRVFHPFWRHFWEKRVVQNYQLKGGFINSFWRPTSCKPSKRIFQKLVIFRVSTLVRNSWRKKLMVQISHLRKKTGKVKLVRSINLRGVS